MWMFLDEQWVNLSQICRVKFTTPNGRLQAFLFMSDARSITVKEADELAALGDYLESRGDSNSAWDAEPAPE